MAVTLQEKGISPVEQAPENKEPRPFADVSLEEIARVSGGAVHYFRGEPLRVDYGRLGVTIGLDTQGSPISAHILERENRYPLGDTVVFIEKGSVTFVEPVRRRYDANEASYAWMVISEEEGFLRLVKTNYDTPDHRFVIAARWARKRLDEKEIRS